MIVHTAPAVGTRIVAVLRYSEFDEKTIKQLGAWATSEIRRHRGMARIQSRHDVIDGIFVRAALV